MLSILYCISNVFYQVSILFYNQSCVVSTPGDNFQFFLIGFRINSDYAKDTYSTIFSIFFLIKLIKLMPCFMVGLVGNDLWNCKQGLPWVGSQRSFRSFVTIQLQPQVCLFYFLSTKHDSTEVMRSRKCPFPLLCSYFILHFNFLLSFMCDN